jgi:hypothetical protein
MWSSDFFRTLMFHSVNKHWNWNLYKNFLFKPSSGGLCGCLWLISKSIYLSTVT